MKKIFLIAVIVLMLTGCGEKNLETWNLEAVDYKLIAYQDPEYGKMFKDSGIMTLEKMASKYDFHDSYIEEGLIRMPTTTSKYNMYFILKPKEGKEEEVKKEMKALFQSIADMIQSYSPLEYDKINNRLEKKIDDYLIYIVSDNNEKVFSLMEEVKNGIL